GRDGWLGEAAFDNPAALQKKGGEISGQFQHVSRQDLHARNREFDEQSNFIDFAGGWVAYPVGAVGLSAYAYQPVLRLESNAFQRGTAGGPTDPPPIHTPRTPPPRGRRVGAPA